MPPVRACGGPPRGTASRLGVKRGGDGGGAHFRPDCVLAPASPPSPSPRLPYSIPARGEKPACLPAGAAAWKKPAGARQPLHAGISASFRFPNGWPVQCARRPFRFGRIRLAKLNYTPDAICSSLPAVPLLLLPLFSFFVDPPPSGCVRLLAVARCTETILAKTYVAIRRRDRAHHTHAWSYEHRETFARAFHA